MLKKFFLILLLLLIQPVQAGVLEDALQQNDKVVLYLYTPQCRYCKQSEPVFRKLSNNYKNKVKFVKVDATTEYGMILSLRHQATYVPYVVMIDSKLKEGYRIIPSCMIDYSCANQALSDFVK